jgi:hypothetical protein
MIKKSLFFLILATLLLSCGKKYIINDNKVYLTGMNENGNYERLIDNADAKTFESLDLKCECNFTFGKDINHLFIDGIKMEGINPNSFKFLGNYIFRDKDSAYFFGVGGNMQDRKIHNINPDKIKFIKYPWAKAENKLIHGTEALELDDLSDLVLIDEDWGKTKTKIIYHGKVLKDADYQTFQIINSYSGGDKNHIFEFGKIVATYTQ